MGARNAAHADTFTAASASHIRIALKDDTLGLGARPKRDLADEPTGLDAFQGLLGRLNGKSDLELEKEQRKRDDIKLARYAEKKWQSPRFISGGFLVQEKVEPLAAKKADKNSQESCSKESSDRQQKDAVTDTSAGGLVDSSTEPPESGAASDTSRRNALPTEPAGDDGASTPEKKKRKKKSKKRKRTGDNSEAQDDERNKKSSKRPASQPRSETGTTGETADSPLEATKPRERIPMGRHVFRSRHIQQKKRALMDDKSLNEVIENHMFLAALCLRQASANLNRYLWSSREICMRCCQARLFLGCFLRFRLFYIYVCSAIECLRILSNMICRPLTLTRRPLSSSRGCRGRRGGNGPMGS